MLKWFLNELWRKAWKSSRIDVEGTIRGHLAQVRGDGVFSENDDNGDKEKCADLRDIYGIE